jgi:hypothetical protein
MLDWEAGGLGFPIRAPPCHLLSTVCHCRSAGSFGIRTRDLWREGPRRMCRLTDRPRTRSASPVREAAGPSFTGAVQSRPRSGPPFVDAGMVLRLITRWPDALAVDWEPGNNLKFSRSETSISDEPGRPSGRRAAR